jgi:acetyl esterase/lipase
MGHSSGGHLAALIGTDPQYLRRAGLDISSVAGVILLDGAGLVPPTGVDATRRRGPFGSEEERQAMAPVNHVALPNAPSFVMLNASSEDLRQQARTLADGLNAAGTDARVRAIVGTDHASLSANLGRTGDAATAVVEEYLNNFTARRSE